MVAASPGVPDSLRRLVSAAKSSICPTMFSLDSTVELIDDGDDSDHHT